MSNAVTSQSKSTSYRTPAVIEAEYVQRRWDVSRLSRQGRIEIVDVQALDRLGRFSVACDHWSLCDETARHALLNDGHAHVRSAAQISAREANRG